ncbi:fimbrial protein [Providencia sp. PROV258]|uniref:fimbrial protein n=1 Tax=Providencia sp. PROV258 TaxID=2949946 RepID=UPI00234B5282|nr:fimbrial protein [Providencia sp. PROV258]
MLLMQHVTVGVKALIVFSVLFFSSLLFGSLFHVVRADTANLNLTLTITMPPQCSFSSGNSIQIVRFGEVQQGLIDGVSYKRTPIDTGLSCGPLEKNALNMGLSWDKEVTFNGISAVSTSRTNLGIAIYRDSTRLSNGASINFTYGNPPNLYAVPIKPSGVMLSDAGSFSGTMTVTLNYQ